VLACHLWCLLDGQFVHDELSRPALPPVSRSWIWNRPIRLADAMCRSVRGAPPRSESAGPVRHCSTPLRRVGAAATEPPTGSRELMSRRNHPRGGSGQAIRHQCRPRASLRHSNRLGGRRSSYVMHTHRLRVSWLPMRRPFGCPTLDALDDERRCGSRTFCAAAKSNWGPTSSPVPSRA
jgi:hypothetical protein